MRNVIALFYFVGSENPCIYSVPNRKQSYEVDAYINPGEDYYGYMSQHLEMDSEKYAEFGVQEYYTRIETWIEENEPEI